jgi:glycine dehydrogenase subunit 1
MRFDYLVHTDGDRRDMLRTIGLSRVEQLFESIPTGIRLDRPLALEPPKTAVELQRVMRHAASQCETTLSHLSFIGGGFYEHFVHPAIDAIVGRGEFLTAYTPYQPSMSQGLLRALFDYQSLTARLCGLPVANSSCYDGACAMADAAWMACNATGRRSIAIARTVWPEWQDIVSLYLKGRGVALIVLDVDRSTGRLAVDDVDTLDVAAVICQTPNALGVIEDIAQVASAAHARGMLLIVGFNPLLSGIACTPGELGADIVCAEGQPLGLHLNAGGPGLGMLACASALASHMTGRIVASVGLASRQRYELVFQEREQHVAREHALSNICSNQALCAVRAAIHLSLLGEDGFTSLAERNTALAHTLADLVTKIPGVSLPYSGPFFNEFVIRLPCRAAPALAALRSDKIFGGLPATWTGHDTDLLIAVTETKNVEDLEFFVRRLARHVAGSK